MRHKNLLVVDDDESLRRITQMQLEEAGYAAVTAANGDEALRRIDEDAPALVITDLKMPGISGLELLRKVREQYPQTAVVLVTAFGTVQTAVAAMKAGAYYYITKPIDYEELLLVVHRAVEHQQLLEEVRTLRASLDQKYGFESITGQSKELLHVLEMASRVAQREVGEKRRRVCGDHRERKPAARRAADPLPGFRASEGTAVSGNRSRAVVRFRTPPGGARCRGALRNCAAAAGGLGNG